MENSHQIRRFPIPFGQNSNGKPFFPNQLMFSTAFSKMKSMLYRYVMKYDHALEKPPYLLDHLRCISVILAINTIQPGCETMQKVLNSNQMEKSYHIFHLTQYY